MATLGPDAQVTLVILDETGGSNVPIRELERREVRRHVLLRRQVTESNILRAFQVRLLVISFYFLQFSCSD